MIVSNGFSVTNHIRHTPKKLALLLAEPDFSMMINCVNASMNKGRTLNI